jgi:hypothetical protein
VGIHLIIARAHPPPQEQAAGEDPEEDDAKQQALNKMLEFGYLVFVHSRHMVLFYVVRYYARGFCMSENVLLLLLSHHHRTPSVVPNSIYS